VQWNLSFTMAFSTHTRTGAPGPLWDEERPMTFSGAIKGYEGFTRRLAARAAVQFDALLNAPRQIRTERFDFVLGGEAIPAPIAARAPVFRR
jgi:hypothetical protein